MIDDAARRLLKLAGYILVPANDNTRFGAKLWRCKRPNFRDRFEAARVAALADEGLLELDGRRRWARLTETGRKALEITP